MAVHARAEARFLRPAVRRRIPEGQALAARELGGQDRIDHLLRDLARRSPDDARFDALLSQLVVDAQDHVTGQEARLFPSLADAADTDELRILARRLRRSRPRGPAGGRVARPDPDPADRLMRRTD
ncbi:hypothetical protein [Yinghuangia soli]|uniref:Hemerythrin HHE cation binding domain-containing protein n=1 Tax=Yinghuangia soli TaxID=2908204 RepID=A0AA41PZ98_9ACTN|nr:hypothetical protein [Yinghuangia soli]MCF2527202.1 hypothetical protein [Yinghuangia soli]